jgi:hypothetical protein
MIGGVTEGFKAEREGVEELSAAGRHRTQRRKN